MSSETVDPAIDSPHDQPHDKILDTSLVNLFKSLQNEEEKVSVEALIERLARQGLNIKDPRLKHLSKYKKSDNPDEVSFKKFCQLVSHSFDLISKALCGLLIIPDFSHFSKELEVVFNMAKQNDEGQVTAYIPQLAKMEPYKCALSICTTDGQICEFGDTTDKFAVQSTSKPVTYCLAIEEHGTNHVHQYVGREPSGSGFNALTLNAAGKPHNPMLNAGAISTCSLIKADAPLPERFDFMLDQFKELTGSEDVTFNNSMYLSEKATADRNFALAYFMRENKVFDDGVDVLEVLDFYIQSCSIEMNVKSASVLAATLANGGINPLTGRRVLKDETVKNCLSLMNSCGMYDFSGEFAFTVGLPAKSGVSGVIYAVVPNVMGIAFWSPKIDYFGNSCRGITFFEELVKKFNFHNYDIISGTSQKHDPTLRHATTLHDNILTGCWAASIGDLDTMRELVASGADLDAANYDGRTPLHLAASQGELPMVKYLATKIKNIHHKDRWGQRPIDDARRGGHTEVVTFLDSLGATDTNGTT